MTQSEKSDCDTMREFCSAPEKLLDAFVQKNLAEHGICVDIFRADKHAQMASLQQWQTLQKRMEGNSPAQKAWQISHTQAGAPFIKQQPHTFISKAATAFDASFSVQALCAANRPIGLDLEILKISAQNFAKSSQAIIASANVFLHGDEQAALQKAHLLKDEATLLSYWCAKEAYVKAIQLGASRDFSRLMISFGNQTNLANTSEVKLLQQDFQMIDNAIPIKTHFAKLYLGSTPNTQFFLAIVML